MAALIYHLLSSSALVSLGLYQLINTTRNHLKFPREYFARLYHPLYLSSSSSSPSPSPSPSSFWQRMRHLQLYLLILCLIIAFVHQIIVSAEADPLLKGHTPVHRFTSLQSAAVLFLFLVLSIALLLSEITTPSVLPLPPDLFFGVAASVFFLQYSVSSSSASVQISDLQAKCDSVSALISVLSSILCLVLACFPRLFVADVGLGASFCLQGLWALQTGLSLYVDVFIPEGCHKLLDVVRGVEGSTKCELDDSKLRAVAILDLVFMIHVLFVLVIVLITYAVVARTVGNVRAFGSYEALPTAAAADSNHIQMKELSGTQA